MRTVLTSATERAVRAKGEFSRMADKKSTAQTENEARHKDLVSCLVNVSRRLQNTHSISLERVETSSPFYIYVIPHSLQKLLNIETSPDMKKT